MDPAKIPRAKNSIHSRTAITGVTAKTDTKFLCITDSEGSQSKSQGEEYFFHKCLI